LMTASAYSQCVQRISGSVMRHVDRCTGQQ
jgi:hypothetical protein